jgi:hypothetical protein
MNGFIDAILVVDGENDSRSLFQGTPEAIRKILMADPETPDDWFICLGENNKIITPEAYLTLTQDERDPTLKETLIIRSISGE